MSEREPSGFANKQVVVLAAGNEKLAERVGELEQAIIQTIQLASGREDEWGVRAVACFDVLRKAIDQ